MLKLVSRTLLMVALLGVSAAAAMVLIPPDGEDYLAVIRDKMEMLEGSESPKILFVGGSNLAFGLDSRRVEEETGYHVLNMGLGFNMGLRFMLDLVKPEIRSGDVVVLVPEYNLFFGLFNGDERLIDVLELYPRGLRYIRTPAQYYILLKSLPRHVQFKINRFLRTLGREVDPDCIYCPRAFNEYGDVVAHLELPSKDVTKMDFLRSAKSRVDDTAIAAINVFGREVEARGARIFMLFPCIPDVHYARKQEHIERLYGRLKRELTIPLLASPSDYTFPIEYFYDWVYHLNREGRQLRTARVIADVMRALGEDDSRTAAALRSGATE